MSTLKATIDRIESSIAVLISEDGAELTVPVAKLPQGAVPGSVVHITITTEAAATADKENLAKKILNEILKKQ